MRKPLLSVTPTKWLESLGKSASQISEILGSYATGTIPQVYVYTAPHLFLRFHGSGGRNPIFVPNYWADGSAYSSVLERANQFEGYLNDSEIKNIAKNYYRDITAICHNWNPLNSNTLWKIELCGSESVEGLEGIIASQPTHAATHTEIASTSTLHGGGVQMFLNPKTPFICTPVNWEYFF
jgi:hypothetical protein